jgi:large subunit ribosomal protein L15
MTSMALNTIKSSPGSRRRRKRVGRGPGSGKGKTAGRGMKGQRSRSGGKRGLKLKGMKQMLLRIPKTRGFKSGRIHPQTVTLDQLERWFASGAHVSARALKARGLIPPNAPGAKVVHTGKVSKALTIVDLKATPGARAAIEKAGGSFAPAGKPLAKKAGKK